jgi:hypothetical protein
MPAILPNSPTNCFCEPGPANGRFDEFCCILPPNSQIELCELNVTYPDPPYHIFIHSGAQTLIVCALEKFIDSTTSSGQRRKTDFVLIGPNPKNAGQVFVVFLEMRSELHNGDEVRQKVAQCRDAIDLLCKCKTNYLNFHGDLEIRNFVDQIPNVQNHTVAAAIVPALSSSSRCLGTRIYSFPCDGTIQKSSIVPLPYQLFQKESITWERVLCEMGLI